MTCLGQSKPHAIPSEPQAARRFRIFPQNHDAALRPKLTIFVTSPRTIWHQWLTKL